MIKIGNRYKIKYNDWISDRSYEVISKEAGYYIIGIDRLSIRDEVKIFGWPKKEYERKCGMRYNRFWYVVESELIEHCNYMELE